MYQYSAITLLEEAAKVSPTKCAVIDEHGSCTFAELRNLSRRAATALRSRGLAPEQGVVIVAEKGLKTLATMLGALYAGSFYAPVDPDAPSSRIKMICATLGTPLVIANDDICPALAEAVCGCSVIPLSQMFSEPASLTGPLTSRPTIDADPAYVMFTSGSTGSPKGVVVSHRATVGFIKSFVATFGICEEDVIANQAPFDFDVSVKDIYGSLASRATLVIVPRRLFLAPSELVNYLHENRVSIMTWAVAALCLMTTFHALDDHNLPSVRMILFSGEVMPPDHLKEWMERLPTATFVNLYGPTEVTCNCLFHILDRSRNYREGVPLGTALPNREVALLNANGAVVTKAGEIGELVVRGSFLASGYIGASPKDDRAFSAKPWHGLCGERVYRTGDLAKLNATGELIYCGRMDNQIKHMGHRIELEGIEAAFESLAKVRRCRCVYHAERKRIIAFFEGDVTDGEIREFMQEHLQPAMRPGRFIHVRDMPITKNGKVDRKALLRGAIQDYEQ